MEIKKTILQKFNYDLMTDRDKQIVKEVINFLKEEDTSNLDERKEKAILQKFQITDVPRYNLDDSNFIRHIRKLKMFFNDQAVIRVGKYPDMKEFPIINVQSDIRDFEKLYASIADETFALKNVSEKNK